MELFDPLAVPKPIAARPPPDVSIAVPFRGIPDSDDPLKRDFRLFLVVLWRYLGFPDPTPIQMSMAWFLQHGPDRMVIMAFRGVAKSFITGAFCLWVLYCDPQQKIMVVSGSLKRAVAFVNWCLQLIREVPELKHLAPLPNQRASSTAFDVAPARPDQTPSLYALGMGGQAAGWRANLIVPDDVETATNSLTVLMREKNADLVQEFESVIKPGGRIAFLGTPHSEASLYNTLGQRGYTIRIWPCRYPTREQIGRYGERLAPYIRHRLKKEPNLAGLSTEPTRFPEEDLTRREMGMTSAEFQLQFMLDTSLADAEKYPLKCRDLIVMALDPKRGPDHAAWGTSEHLILKTLPLLGFEGDRYYAPAAVSTSYSPWSEVVAGLDTSGRGDDETSLTVAAELNGLAAVLANRGWRDGYGEATLRELAAMLVFWRVQRLVIETNFGDGMFLALLQPHVIAAWEKANRELPESQKSGTSLEEVRAVLVQKEKRILSVVEPLVKSHRVLMNEDVINEDYQSIATKSSVEGVVRYALMHQYTHLTYDKDSIAHDDRLDSMSIALSLFAERMGVDPVGMSKRAQDAKEEEELEALFADADEVGGWTPKGGRTQRAQSALPHAR